MLEFVKVIHNEDDRKQAVFMLPPEDGTPAQFFLYSYVNNEMANETMVMQRLVDHLVSKGDLICEQEA